jgi:hypothetical protein
MRRLVALLAFSALSTSLLADGKIFRPRDYKGSLEERAQEAIIIFHRGKTDDDGKVVGKGASEDLILKISVESDQTVDLESFGWVVPFPSAPKIAKEDGKLFKECFDYIQARLARRFKNKGKGDAKSASGAKPAADLEKGVEVISRKVVGSYDTVVLREKRKGALNEWLEENGFQTLDDDDEVVSWYREKGYVFACMKVRDVALKAKSRVDLHPLRFSFHTGGIDGIYFPMKLTGLQKETFDVNLYVFYNKWINDRLSRFGYVHRGFELQHRDWDTDDCEANAGKAWSDPSNDPYLASLAHRVPKLKKLFQKLHPGEKYYLTQIRARRLDPADVREWKDDLWLFPYYTSASFIPYDVRNGGPAAEAYPHVGNVDNEAGGASSGIAGLGTTGTILVALGGSLVLVLGGVVLLRRTRKRK